MAADARLPLNFTRRDGVVHAFEWSKTDYNARDNWHILRSKCGKAAKHNPEKGQHWDRLTNDKVTCIECLGFPE